MNEFINRNSGEVIATIIITLLLITVLTLSAISKHHTRAMADKGYVQQALPGTTNTIWVKDNVCY